MAQAVGVRLRVGSSSTPTPRHQGAREQGPSCPGGTAGTETRGRGVGGGVKIDLDNIYIQYFHSFILLLRTVKLPAIQVSFYSADFIES